MPSVEITSCRRCPFKQYDREYMIYLCRKSHREILVWEFEGVKEKPEWCELEED